ncbi:uncharacterized protein [Ptychodera flava]|uniref:uncharacterized protein isoform X2 n=1 Tax=Ptychodera flava TaxID=63121 RepID=UPI00396A95AA
MCIALTKHVKQYGIDRMVANFISGVNKLTEGYIMNLRGEEKLVNGALLAFIGDTLSSNFIAGFKESVSFAERKCRTCLCSTQDMKTKFSDEEFDKRDLQQHLHHCELLSNSTTKQEKQHWSKTYGVTQLSVFHQTLGFNICTGFPHDMMHVLLEGVVPLEVKLLLRYCIGEQYFSMNQVNAKLKFFSYGYSERKNKPPIYKNNIDSGDTKIKQSASQMLLLCEILPFLIGQKLPQHDHRWKSFQLSRQIVRLSSSFALHERFGPLRQHWCMRLEAKHNFFKNEVSCNFKNLAKSLSQRHQLWMCSQLVPGNTEAFLYAGHELRGGTSLPVADNDYRVALERKFQELGEGAEDFLKLQCAVVYGEEFRTGGYILYREEDMEGFPVFARISEVVSLIGILCAVIKIMETHSHNSHYDCYRIDEVAVPQYTCVQLSNLKHHKVLHAHLVDGQQFISVNQIPVIELLE